MKRIGLMSDTHAQAATARHAVTLLLQQDIDLLLHMGDVGSESVIDAMAAINPKTGKQVDAQLVFGNTDYHFDELGRYAASLGITDRHPVGKIHTPRGTLIFTHGDNEDIMGDAITAGAAYLCHGHTHAASSKMFGATNVINPGALFRASRYTVAVLDTEKNDVKFYEVPRE